MSGKKFVVGIAIIVVLLFCFPLHVQVVSKAQLGDIYLDKYDQMQSFSLSWAEHTKYYDKGGKPKMETMFLEDALRAGDQVAFSTSIVNAQDGSHKVVARRVFAEGKRKALYCDEEGTHSTGFIDHDQDSIRASDFAPWFLGFALLAPLFQNVNTMVSPDAVHSDMRSLLLQENSRMGTEKRILNMHTCDVIQFKSGKSPIITQWYVDEAIGYAVRRMEVLFSSSSGEGDHILHEVDYDDFMEATPNFFLPKKAIEKLYRSDGSIDFVREITDITMNLGAKIPQEAFKLTFPDGTEVTDRSADVTSTYLYNPVDKTRQCNEEAITNLDGVKTLLKCPFSGDCV